MTSTTNLVASSIITTFVPPTDEPSIVGYYSSGTQVATIACTDGYEFLVSSSYGICCAIESAGNCDFQQTCTGTSMIVYGDGQTLTCANNDPCVETTLFQRQPSNGWSATMAWCMDPDNPTSIYRSFVGTQLTLVPEDSFTTTTASSPDTTNTGDIPTRTDSTFTTSRTTTPDTDNDPSPSGSEGSNETTTPQTETEDSGSGTNVGAIAGGVVGGVAGLVLIILAIWFVLRQKKKKNAELREIGAGYVAPEPK